MNTLKMQKYDITLSYEYSERVVNEIEIVPLNKRHVFEQIRNRLAIVGSTNRFG